MSQEHTAALQRLKRRMKGLMKYMNANTVVKYMFDNKGLSQEQKDDILMKPSNITKYRMLIDTLEEQPDWVYYCFLDGLLATEQNYTFHELEKGTYLFLFLHILSAIYFKLKSKSSSYSFHIIFCFMDTDTH